MPEKELNKKALGGAMAGAGATLLPISAMAFVEALRDFKEVFSQLPNTGRMIQPPNGTEWAYIQYLLSQHNQFLLFALGGAAAGATLLGGGIALLLKKEKRG